MKNTAIEDIIEKIKVDETISPETRSYLIATYLRPGLNQEKDIIKNAWIFGTLETMHPFATAEDYFNHTFFKDRLL
jgi:hypothetical protein